MDGRFDARGVERTSRVLGGQLGMRRLMGTAVLVICASGCAPLPVVTSASRETSAFVDLMGPGASVRVKSRSGTFKPEETGHAAEVNVTAGKTGVIVQTFGEIARVRFDAQTWDEYPPTGATVHLSAFEATIHRSYLEAAR